MNNYEFENAPESKHEDGRLEKVQGASSGYPETYTHRLVYAYQSALKIVPTRVRAIQRVL